MAGTVEFREVDGLPGTELQLAILHDDADGRAHQAGFQVGIAVAFAVAIVGFMMRYKMGQFLQQIVAHIRIGVLVNGHAGSGVGDKDCDGTIHEAACLHNVPDFVGYVHQLASGLR